MSRSPSTSHRPLHRCLRLVQSGTALWQFHLHTPTSLTSIIRISNVSVIDQTCRRQECYLPHANRHRQVFRRQRCFLHEVPFLPPVSPLTTMFEQHFDHFHNVHLQCSNLQLDPPGPRNPCSCRFHKESLECTHRHCHSRPVCRNRVRSCCRRTSLWLFQFQRMSNSNLQRSGYQLLDQYSLDIVK